MTSTPGSAGPTDAPTPPPSELPATVKRFTRAERHVHRATAVLTLTCVATAACLYLPFLAELVGRRHLVVTVHIWTGVLIPLPYLLGLFSRAFRADLTLLGRFTSYDRDWLRAARRRQFTRPAGKFNAGQKLYAGWIAGAALVMLGTGLLMWLTHLTPVAWRTSATFVHDWLALTMGIVIAGHLWMALTHPESRHAMRTGHMNRHSATNEHPHWHP